MDDKASRRKWLLKSRRHRTQFQHYGPRIATFVKTQKKAILTGFLSLVSIVMLFAIFSQLKPPVISSIPTGVTAIDYSTFIQQVKAGNVAAVTIRGGEIQGLLTHPLTQTDHTASSTASTSNTVSRVTQDEINEWVHSVSVGNIPLSGISSVASDRSIYTHIPGDEDGALTSLLLNNHVAITTLPPVQPASWVTILWHVVPLIFLALLLLGLFAARNTSQSPKRVDDRFMNLGKSKARRFDQTQNTGKPVPTNTKKLSVEAKRPVSVMKNSSTTTTARVMIAPPVSFADVAGIDEVRSELEEIVQFLRSPERYHRLGARIPRGALLVGPPGTGKTLLAKAVAGEAGVPFFSVSASEFVEMFVGVGASRVRDLFQQARQFSPSVIFIDEIDAVGRKRSMRATGNDERDQTLNQLLVELDGFDPRHAVVVMAATNRVDILDKALLRPGRFDRRITVSLPTRAGREAILKVHTRYTPLAEDVQLDRLARMTAGMSGADLANLVNEAALCAARRDLPLIDHDCFEDALARVQLGALRPIVMSEAERRIIAYHEGGHALVAHHLPEADTVNRVTILPRGQSLGVTQFTSEEDRFNYSRQTLMERIAVGLGGRVAEELVFGSDRVTTGAENDFQVVTDLARRMVTRWGMSEQIGVVFADSRSENEYALAMRRLELDELPAQARSLAYDAMGNLVLNGASIPPQRYHKMAISSSANGNGMVMNALIDAEVQRILNEGKAMAMAILTEHREQLDLLANTLMELEQLDRTQFESLLQ